jgi:hypothetical protein
LLTSYKVVYRIARCEKPYSNGESFVLSAAIDVIETIPAESYARELR